MENLPPAPRMTQNRCCKLAFFHHWQALAREVFRCFCPTVFVSYVGGKKIKTPKGGKKKSEFVLRLAGTVLTHFLSAGGIVRMRYECDCCMGYS